MGIFNSNFTVSINATTHIRFRSIFQRNVDLREESEHMRPPTSVRHAITRNLGCHSSFDKIEDGATNPIAYGISNDTTRNVTLSFGRLQVLRFRCFRPAP